MAFATGGFHGANYVKEVTFGVTPATPEMTAFRTTGTSLVLSKNTFQSNELRSDRQISDLRHGSWNVGGSLDFEFSYGSFDAWLESALLGTWTTDVLKVGVTPSYFSVERAFTDISQYQVFTGCTVNSFSLSIQPDSIITGSFGILGRSSSTSSSPLDATPTAAPTSSPYDSFTGELVEGGVTIGVVTGIDLSLDNGAEATMVSLSGPLTPRIVQGRSNLTGTLSAYFENTTLLDKFINETESSLVLTIGDGTNTSYVIEIPRIKYTGGDNAVSDEGPITLSMPFQAIYDSTEGTNLKITRVTV